MKTLSIREILCALMLVTTFGASFSVVLNAAVCTDKLNRCSLLWISIAFCVVGVVCTWSWWESRSGRMGKVLRNVLCAFILPLSCVFTSVSWCVLNSPGILAAAGLPVLANAEFQFQKLLLGTYYAVYCASKTAVSDKAFDNAVAFVGDNLNQLDKEELEVYSRRFLGLYRQTDSTRPMGAGAEALAKTIVAKSRDDSPLQKNALQALEHTLLAQGFLYEADMVLAHYHLRQWSDPETFHVPYIKWQLSRIEKQKAFREFRWGRQLYPDKPVTSWEIRWDDTMSVSKAEFQKLLKLARNPLKEKLGGEKFLYPSNSAELLVTLNKMKSLRVRNVHPNPNKVLQPSLSQAQISDELFQVFGRPGESEGNIRIAGMNLL